MTTLFNLVKERDVIKKILSYLSRFTPLVKFYSRVLVICLGTIIYGIFLIKNHNNVVERVILFPRGFSVTFGTIMIIVSITKLLSVFRYGFKLKKYALIAITLCWLTIGWSYLTNSMPNNSFVMAFTITALCYVELWRGDYGDD